MKKQLIETGKIVGTHGVRGQVKLEPWSDSPEFLLDFDRLFIGGQPVKVLSSSVHKGMLICALEGYDDVESAGALRGKTVSIHRDDASLPEGSFFIEDIIGLPVYDENGAELGRLDSVLFQPASNVYVVKGEHEYMIPAVPAFILETADDHITVRLIEGLRTDEG